MSTLETTVRARESGERRWFCGGGVHTWLATERETGGAYLLFEDALDAGKVTPLHQHPDADETFYMLEGEVRLHIAGAEQALAAGGIAIIPRGVPHAFAVTTPTARMLCLQTPGGGEAFYRSASEPAGAGAPPMPDFGRVAAAAAATGSIEILGPPPF
ncbi:cupin domain-containing protein [Microbacterium sp. 2MCAF23]|uniref:cupin domain-containing protein n=1 Tax=Microbacterium sp. 2MCAF23 TaxID=3232985 RepID=UPI003F9743FB